MVSNIYSLWYLWDYWESLDKVLQGFNFAIRYVFKEGNKVVGFLALEGERGKMMWYLNSNNILRLIHCFNRMDNLGFPIGVLRLSDFFF